MKITDIFEEEPKQWGLRGDPFLWRELKARFQSTEMPETPVQLKELIEKEYEEVTGHPITNDKHLESSALKVTACPVEELALISG
jgi:hypothetical protein